MADSLIWWGIINTIILSSGVLSENISPHAMADRILHGRNYIKYDPPSNPTEVQIGIYVNRITEIDDADNMQMTLNMYMRHRWIDDRLAFKPEDLKDNVTSFTLGDEYWQDVWIPDLFFRNGIKVDKHEVMRENVLLKLHDDGTVWLVTHLTGSFYCPMKLHKYPFDTQKCSILIESYRYTLDSLKLIWLDSAVEIDQSVELPNFVLQKVERFDCSQTYKLGSYPCLMYELILKRDSGFFFIQVFLPTIIVIILSWFCLWIDKEFHFQRIALIFILVMMLITLNAFYGVGMAQVSYVKALDIWMILCLLFVIAALIESTIVKVLANRGTEQYQHEDNNTRMRLKNANIAQRVDKVSRVAFPLAFLLTMIIYFGLYRG